MELALATFGDASIAARIERIVFNALPGTFADDMWAHQYDQQANQIQCSLNSKPWTTNGPESNLFGLESHFSCCAANFHQGWPKFAASLCMRPREGGLAAVLCAPCTVQTRLNTVPISLSVETDYPFRDGVVIEVSPEKEIAFPLHLRIPEWADAVKIAVNG